jgi:mRNA interferase HigB
VRVISRKALREFWSRPECADSKEPLRSWFRLAAKADWSTPAEIKSDFRSASIVANNRVVFNIAGNKYRLVVKVNYPYRVFYIRFVGTHREYDQIDATTV